MPLLMNVVKDYFGSCACKLVCAWLCTCATTGIVSIIHNCFGVVGWGATGPKESVSFLLFLFIRRKKVSIIAHDA